MKDPESWHRHRGTAKCASARERTNAKYRARYAVRVALKGRTVQPRDAWKPGTEVLLPEEDPL